MTLPLGSAVEGFQAGVQFGQQLADRQRQQKAQAALFAGMGGQPPPPGAPPGPGGPPPPTMGGGPVPGSAPGGPMSIAGGPPPGGPPRPVAMPGAQPMPQGGPPPPPQAGPIQAMPPRPAMMGPQMGGGPPQAQQPQGGGGPPPPAVSSAVRPTGNLVQDSRQTLMSIAQDIKQRNPGIDPKTLFVAVQQQIALMKGIEPETRAVMQNDLGMQRLQVGMQEAIMKAKTPEEVAQIRGQYGLQIAEMNGITREDIEATRQAGQTSREGSREQSQERIAGGHDASGVKRAEIGAGSRVTVAQLQAQGGVDRANIEADARRDVAEDRIDADRYKSDEDYRKGIDSNIAKTTGKAPKGGGAGRDRQPGYHRSNIGRHDTGGGNSGALISQAKQAIAQGAPRAAVIARLKKMGVNPAGL